MTLARSYRSSRFPVWIALPLLLALAGDLAAWFALGALPDEAYYWVWSQRLQSGYFDHPPLVAWLIHPFAVLFNNAVWAIRIPAVLSWLVGAWVGYDLTRRVYGSHRAGLLAVLVWTTLPMTQIGFHVVTPDAPLMIFAWLTYDLAQRALTRGGTVRWLLAGACAGLTVTGKYTGVLVPFGILIALLLSRDGRRRLATGGPWLAAVASLVAFAPVVFWNWQHDWISFAYQFGHGVHDTVQAAPLAMAGVFLAGQFAVAMPWTWLGMAWSALRSGGTPASQPVEVWHLLQVGFWLPLLLFGLAGLTAKGHPNWPITAYVPGTVLFAGLLARWLWPAERLSDAVRPLRAAAVLVLAMLPVLAVNLLRFPDWMARAGIPLPPQRTQLSQSYGWDRVDAALRAQLKEIPDGGSCTVLGNRLQTASMLGLLLNDALRVGVPDTTRLNQFHLWQGPAGPHDACLYVEQFEERDTPTGIADLGKLGRWPRVELITVHNPDQTVRRYGFYRPPAGVPKTGNRS